MKTAFWVCGKTKKKFIAEGISFYLQRIRPFAEISYQELEVKKAQTKEEIIRAEADMILKSLKTGDYIVLLDEKGEMLSSVDFASSLSGLFSKTSGRLVFIGGGPYGFSESIYSKANYLLSLSKMTLTHELVRIFFLEQLYRAFTILKNHPYHH